MDQTSTSDGDSGNAGASEDGDSSISIHKVASKNNNQEDESGYGSGEFDDQSLAGTKGAISESEVTAAVYRASGDDTCFPCRPSDIAIIIISLACKPESWDPPVDGVMRTLTVRKTSRETMDGVERTKSRVKLHHIIQTEYETILLHENDERKEFVDRHKKVVVSHA